MRYKKSIIILHPQPPINSTPKRRGYNFVTMPSTAENKIKTKPISHTADQLKNTDETNIRTTSNDKTLFSEQKRFQPSVRYQFGPLNRSPAYPSNCQRQHFVTSISDIPSSSLPVFSLFLKLSNNITCKPTILYKQFLQLLRR